MAQRSDDGHDSPFVACPEKPVPARARTAQQRPAWVSSLKRFENPDVRKATIQLIDTAVPYSALLAGMYLTIRWELPYWVTLLAALPASGFLVRLFIFFHDCSHGSYLHSRRAMKVLGTIIGIMTFIPFSEWRALHSVHHSSSGNLDRRGVGDVWTMTVDEYLSGPRLRRLLYRAFRSPLIMFGLGPLYAFLIAHRIPSRGARKDQIASVVFSDAVLAATLAGAALTIGLKAYAMIQLPVILIGGAAGVWLFYVQHQFDPSYWSRNKDWDSLEAALQGSSFYKLPKVLQWFSGNIGFHHIHHLRPRIPNYNLERCLKETRELQLENPLTLWRSLKSVRLNLWDEERRTLISFRELGRVRRQPV
jgi:omega-6 fatty acid desaturase (delta-12 desaturase)